MCVQGKKAVVEPPPPPPGITLSTATADATKPHDVRVRLVLLANGIVQRCAGRRSPPGAAAPLVTRICTASLSAARVR